MSVGTTLLSAAILAGLVVLAGVPAGPANILAVMCGIVPSYIFNRRWVWGRHGRGGPRWPRGVGCGERSRGIRDRVGPGDGA